MQNICSLGFMKSSTTQVLPLGQLVMTPGVQAEVPPDDYLSALQRHARGDWGNVSSGDKKLNDEALTEGTRVLSSYEGGNNVKFWIITEADRSVTTILLPEEY